MPSNKLPLQLNYCSKSPEKLRVLVRLRTQQGSVYFSSLHAKYGSSDFNSRKTFRRRKRNN